MINVVENILKENGIKRVKILSSLDAKIPLYVYVPVYLVKRVPHLVDAWQGVDADVMVTVFEYPMLGPVDIMQGDGALKKFFVVHRRYGRSVSDCVRLGAEGWRRGMGVDPLYGYVRSLPATVEPGREAFGVAVFAAEWMPSDCVAVR